MDSTEAPFHYVAYAKNPQVYAALLKEQACEIHPHLYDCPAFRHLNLHTDHRELQVWLLLDGKRSIEEIASLLFISYENAHDAVMFLVEEQLAYPEIMRAYGWRKSRKMRAFWPNFALYQRYQALKRMPTSFWAYVRNGLQFATPIEKLNTQYLPALARRRV